jgi:hypothetical protein
VQSGGGGGDARESRGGDARAGGGGDARESGGGDAREGGGGDESQYIDKNDKKMFKIGRRDK